MNTLKALKLITVKNIIILSGLLILINACSLAPRYKRPKPPIPDKFPEPSKYTGEMGISGVTEPHRLRWDEFLPDRRLNKIINIALENNRDLKLASLNIERARALYGIQKYELYPSVNAVGSKTKQRTSKDLLLSPLQPRVSQQYGVDLGISEWQIDFFGRIRNLKDEALEKYLGTVHTKRAFYISLVSEIATHYFSLGIHKEQLNLAQQILRNREKIYKLVKKQYELGLIGKSELLLSRRQLKNAKEDISKWIQLIELDKNTLNLLAGSTITTDLLPDSFDDVVLPIDISPGLSSKVLLMRPDILSAEHELKSAYARIGAARAAFFPLISLTTSIGTASDELSRLFDSQTGTWLFAPKIIMPIFEPRTWSAYRVSKVDQKIALTRYEKAIQNAFREVANALAVKSTVTKQLSLQESIVKDLYDMHQLSISRYRNGLDSYLNVLRSKESLLLAKQGLLSLEFAKISSIIRLYLVLGR